jgi:hypothetical protein
MFNVYLHCYCCLFMTDVLGWNDRDFAYLLLMEDNGPKTGIIVASLALFTG